MYITRAIILSREQIRDKQIRTILFSREYGKITAWEKKIFGGDIGSLIDAKIERKGNENILENLSVICMPDTSLWDYATTFEYLYLLYILRELLPYGQEHASLFDDIAELISHTGSHEIHTHDISIISILQLFILIQNRILKMLGILNKEHYTSSLLSIIYERLDTVSMKSMFLSKPLTPDTEMILKKSIHHSTYSYITLG